MEMMRHKEIHLRQFNKYLTMFNSIGMYSEVAHRVCYYHLGHIAAIDDLLYETP